MSELITFEATIKKIVVTECIRYARISSWGQVLHWDPKRMIMKLEDKRNEKRPAMYVINKDMWARGLSLMVSRYPHAYREMTETTGDPSVGELLIQLAAFGVEL